jgi:hypothetical protein
VNFFRSLSHALVQYIKSQGIFIHGSGGLFINKIIIGRFLLVYKQIKVIQAITGKLFESISKN